jgi:hypothetical protein
MNEPGVKTFVTGVLLRRPILRAAALEGIKFSLWFLIFLGAFVVGRYFCEGRWVRGDNWELIGCAIGLATFWLVSVARTISAAYREFDAKR